METIRVVAPRILDTFPDVLYVGKTVVLGEALSVPPKGDLGDQTGDHGKQVEHYLRKCQSTGLIRKVGSLIDIGGQNSETVTRVASVFFGLRSLIVDMNALSPALTDRAERVDYAIGLAQNFFRSDSYGRVMKEITCNLPSLFLMNNLLNTTEATDAWPLVQLVWEKMRPGDYLLVIGFTPDQLENQGLSATKRVHGIIQFEKFGKFCKSALSTEFVKQIIFSLQSAEVLDWEVFDYEAEVGRGKIRIGVEGMRVLVLQKTI